MRTIPPGIATLIEAAGGIADPLESYESARRFRHEDLHDLTDEQLQGEQIAVGVAWAALARLRRLPPDAEHALTWFADRRRLVAAEVGRRGRR